MEKQKIVAYTSEFNPDTKAWTVSPIPPDAQGKKIPRFHGDDTMTFTTPGFFPVGTLVRLVFKKQPAPYRSHLATPFVEFNDQNHQSSYAYVLGEILTFVDDKPKSKMPPRWTFQMEFTTDRGQAVFAEADPELQVGTVIGDGEGGH